MNLVLFTFPQRLKPIYFIVLLSFTLIFGFGCEDVDPAKEQGLGKGVFIINEGNYGTANSSIDFYKSEEKEIISGLYASANGIGPGDVAQSITLFGEHAWLVVNNSGKVDGLNLEDGSIDVSMGGMSSPRYFLGVKPGKAYISDLTSNTISVVDTENAAVLSVISADGWTERMILVNSKAYVGNMTTNEVLVINTDLDEIIARIKVGREPESLVLDGNGDIRVLCTGGFGESLPGIWKINPVVNSVTDSLLFIDIDAYPTDLSINGVGSTLYWLGAEGVYKSDISNSFIPSLPWLNSGSRYWYGLGIDIETEEIYVSDPRDFASLGIALRFNNTGLLLDSFVTGLIPGSFAFKPN